MQIRVQTRHRRNLEWAPCFLLALALSLCCLYCCVHCVKYSTSTRHTPGSLGQKKVFRDLKGQVCPAGQAQKPARRQRPRPRHTRHTCMSSLLSKRYQKMYVRKKPAERSPAKKPWRVLEGVCESGVWRVAIGKTTPETVQCPGVPVYSRLQSSTKFSMGRD